jgi:hypothetical protein
LRLITLICSDSFAFKDEDAAAIYDRSLLLHIQLNPKPRQHQYRLYREKLFYYQGDATELICLNWAGGVREWSGEAEKHWNNPASSAWYLHSKGFDTSDATLSANHKRGLYYTWLNTSRAHVLFLNFEAGAYFIEATKVAHLAQPASTVHRVGPRIRNVFVWDAETGELTERQVVPDGFVSILDLAGGAKSELERLHGVSPLTLERILALCAGKIPNVENWYKVGELDSFRIQPDEIIKRLTFCQDIEQEACEFRSVVMLRCADLWQILTDARLLPAALSDIGRGFRFDWQESRPYQNLVSHSGKPATAMYLGDDMDNVRIEALAKRVTERLRCSAAGDKEGIVARQRTALWFRRGGQLRLYKMDYVSFDDPRTKSEYDFTRQT